MGDVNKKLYICAQYQITLIKDGTRFVINNQINTIIYYLRYENKIFTDAPYLRSMLLLAMAYIISVLR